VIAGTISTTAAQRHAHAQLRECGWYGRGYRRRGLPRERLRTSRDNSYGPAAPGDQNLLDPLLTALGNYGGPTPVHIPKLGSPAIDGVQGIDGPLTNQRGLLRPQGSGSTLARSKGSQATTTSRPGSIYRTSCCGPRELQ
jgi:hypothetical protein